MKNNIILFAVFCVILFLMNSLFLMKPFVQEIGGCKENSIFTCMVSGKLILLIIGYTVFDFLLYGLLFYSVKSVLFLLAGSYTGNQFYRHIIVFVLIKLTLFSVLFFREYMPVNYFYLLAASFLVFALVEIKLAYNELMIEGDRARLMMTVVPSIAIGGFKSFVYFIAYPAGMVMATWQII